MKSTKTSIRTSKKTSIETTTSSKTKSTVIYKSIYDEYFDYQQTHSSTYGIKTCVLLEVGSFFEIYTFKNQNTKEIQHPQVLEISRICNLNLVEKKATFKTDDQQIMMMGFRNYMLDKYIQKLVDNDYTVVVYVQEKIGKDVIRKLHNIYSSGTFVSFENDDLTTTVNTNSSNYIVCIWLESYKPTIYNNTTTSIIASPPQTTIIYGISAINIFTGHTAIFEYETPFIMNPTTFDELERFISTFSPNELIVIAPNMEDKTIQTILKYAGMKCNTVHVVSQSFLQSNKTIQEKIKNCEKQVYIQSILNTYYGGKQIYYHCDEFQQNVIATQSFCYLLDFLKEHNTDLTKKIAFPIFTNTSTHLILANHTLRQLNIINDNTMDSDSSGIYSSVLSFTNRCNSSIGRRRFQRQLLNPTFQEEWLENEYAKIENILNTYNNEKIQYVRKQIGQTRDIEKISRQLILKKIYPSTLYQLYNTVEIMQTIQTFFENTWNHQLPMPFIDVKETNEILDFLNTHLFVDICKNASSMQIFEENIIRPTISIELDTLIEEKKEIKNQLHTLHSYFNQLIQQDQKQENTEYIKIHETEKSGYSFQITKKRATILKKILSKMVNNGEDTIHIARTVATSDKDGKRITVQIKDIHISSSSSSNDEIAFPLLTNICRNEHTLQEKIHSQIAVEYLKIIQILESNWYDKIQEFIEYIGCVDVLINKAYIAREFNYCRPVINKNAIKSCINATKMRHCLIEHLQTSEIYVANDIQMGCDGAGDGILLYGTNAIGKTSLIRSIGICIVLAQAGLYVPCDSFVYKPYTAIYSRIIGNDNLFKHLSTFQVEMSELRVILKQADENSLILGDEVCSSTELESGLSIIMSSLIELHNKRASFIFATHFHEIVDFEEMKDLTRICIKHLEVQYDPVTGKLIYDRKLKDGVGLKSYGLTVCKSMNMPLEFMERAIEIRNRHFPINAGILSSQPSKYNSKKLKGICEKCNCSISSDIHHIEPQKNSDERGFIKNECSVFYKNHPANLMSLCEKCHKEFHSFA